MFQKTEEGELIKDKEYVYLKNIYFELNNTQMQELYKDNKLKCMLIVECSASLFRQSFLISDKPMDIPISLSKLNDIVNISAYIYVKNELENYSNSDFNADYSGYKFDLEQYDIVAIDDGYKFRIDIELEYDNKVASIFTIVRADSKERRIHYESGRNKIRIFLSPEYYGEYNLLKSTVSANNIVFSILVIPVLSRCLDEIKNMLEETDDIEDVIEQKIWVKAICMSYSSVTGSKLTIDEFKEKDSLELAQLVLNDATCKGLKDFSSILLRGPEGGEEYE
jgi:hypothetical protein